jgi:hypothetical protein
VKRDAPAVDAEHVKHEAVRLRPSLTTVHEELKADRDKLIDRAFPAHDSGLHTRAIIGDRSALESTDDDHLSDAVRAQRKRLLDAADRAIAKIQREGVNTTLDPVEVEGLEALINVTVRPAIELKNDTFRAPPPPWDVLERFKADIKSVASKVGRIEMRHPGVPYAGTGFMVGNGLVMTNRHVAELLAKSDGAVWTLNPERAAGITYADDPDHDDAPTLRVDSVAGVHPTLDMALLRLSDVEPVPEAVPLASTGPREIKDHRVYAIGYPTRDPYNGDAIMKKIFGDIYDVKRLQPGELLAIQEGDSTFHHDCSTLGGNSGSCVIDLETGEVLGLHFGGAYLKFNAAVALWMLTEDKFLKKHGVTFA